MNNKIAICILCHIPNIVWLDFLNKFKKYDIYLIIDDNNINYKKILKNFNNIKMIKITEEICKKYGFINVNM